MSQDQNENLWRGKRILVTGACGTIGKELVSQLARKETVEVIGLDNNESELFFMMESYRNNPRILFSLGDVRDPDKVMRMSRGVDIILHTAALKHVILCEQSPRDAVQTNIHGLQNVIDAAMANNVERVIFTSSDKAVNPTNVMGTSKLMGERLMTAANATKRGAGPIFSSTRFGNVLGSRGSVIPLFRRQIQNGGPVTLTDVNMTRFIMTLTEAVQLVMESTFIAVGGEILITKMPTVRISDLATVMIQELAPIFGYDPKVIPIKVIGQKAGEKLYEELMNEEETRRSLELEKFYVVTPAFKSVYNNIQYEYQGSNGQVKVGQPYQSSLLTPMSVAELTDYVRKNRLLDEAYNQEEELS